MIQRNGLALHSVVAKEDFTTHDLSAIWMRNDQEQTHTMRESHLQSLKTLFLFVKAPVEQFRSHFFMSRNSN